VSTPFASKLDSSIDQALNWSRREQHSKGYWVGQLESNSTIEAEWIIAMFILGIDDDPKAPGILRCLHATRRSDGSWGTYHEAPQGDINTTIEAYAALRIAGASPDEPGMRQTCDWILSRGGIAKARVFTKFWMAMIGEWPWSGTPILPPEIIFFPLWFPFNLYNFSSWARATIVPLTVLCEHRPVRSLPPEKQLKELRNGSGTALPRPKQGGWPLFFWVSDQIMAAYRKSPWKPFRRLAIRCCLEWIFHHQEADGCWAGIQPPWIFALLALRAEGYALDHPVMKSGLRAFDPPWAVETKDRGTFLQACNSPVWDTFLTQLAFLDCGLEANDPAFASSLDWVLGQQITAPGDWKKKSPNTPAGGWAFEYENDWYPDVDDTAVGLIVLARSRASFSDPSRIDQAMERALGWIQGMVCRNGAWAAFDKDNDLEWVSLIPFCDFGEALDPPSVDVTAHVVEALAYLGRTMQDPMVARALDYIRSEQEPDGSWFGRWGVNFIYGTAAVIPALQKIGENMESDYVRRACDWLVRHQNPDGGWGESCASYMDDSQRGKGPSTASQTAWALMGLLAQGSQAYQASIQTGVEYLTSTQTSEGSWDELYFTGTGFPGYGRGARTDLSSGKTLDQGSELSRGFMLRYHLYRHYFPLMALGRARTHLSS
jgi:squalene-hopene/tetraprenyl-beta-curcumene cyclase